MLCPFEKTTTGSSGKRIEDIRMNKTFRVLAFIVLAAVAVFAAVTITVTFDTATVTCGANGASVSAPYTISTSAAAYTTVAETLTNSLHAVVASNTYTIDGTWTVAGRTKTYDGTFTALNLANGTYTLQVCATQAGSIGNPDKEVCSNETITVACGSTSNCPSDVTGFFGEVTGNPSIGNGNGGALNINIKGDLGTSVTILITDASGFSRQFQVPENGTSCNYHALWQFKTATGEGADVYGNDGPGQYNIYAWGTSNTNTGDISHADVSTTVQITN